MKSNLEKIILLIALLLFAGCVFLAIQNFNKEAKSVNSIDAASALFAQTPADIAEQTQERVGKEHNWDSPRIYDGKTKLNLFTARPILVPVNDPDPKNPVVIDDPQSKPLHAPIPNAWWLDNNLPYIYTDALERDPDRDGFTNLEEFQAKTDPNDPTKRPDVIQKIVLDSIRDTAETYQYNAFVGSSAILYGGTKDENGNFQRQWDASINEVGQKFGPDENPERFELVQLDGAKMVFRDLEKQEDARNATVTLPYREFFDVREYSAVFRFTLFSPSGSKVTAAEGGEFEFSDLPDYKFRLKRIDLNDPEKPTGLIELLNEDNRTILIGKNGPE